MDAKKKVVKKNPSPQRISKEKPTLEQKQKVLTAEGFRRRNVKSKSRSGK